MGEYAGKRSRTRDAFLQAAFEALAGAVSEGLLAALGPAGLARRAGLSRQTFYRHWPSGGKDFLGDLVAYMLAPERYYESTIIPDLDAIPAADPLTATELVRRAAMVEFETGMQTGPLLSQGVAWVLVIEGAACGGAEALPGVTPALRAYYNDYADDLVVAYGALLDEWGLEMVPGVSLRQLAAVLTGTLEGMGMRWLVDPDLVSPTLYADAVLALVPAFTRRRAGATAGRPASFLGEVFQRTDTAERGAAGAVEESSQRRSGRRRVERSRTAILEAARAEFALRGYQETTVAQIAAAAGVGETTVYEHFGSKAVIAAACFEERHADAVAALAADDSDPMTRLHNHLCRVHALLTADRDGTKALFDAVLQVTESGPPTDPADPRVLVPLPDVMAPVIADAQAAGALGGEADPWEIAEVLVGLVFLNVLMTPMDSEEACRRYEAILFEGRFAASRV